MLRANIMVTTEVVIPGRVINKYFWKGPRLGIVEVGMNYWAKDHSQYPWPLRVVDYVPNCCSIRLARADGPFIISWAYYSALAWIHNTTVVAKTRLILTLMIWGLADVPLNEAASWKYVGKKPTWRWR